MQVLRVKDVVEKTGYCRASIYQKMNKGEFPPCFKMGPRAVGWDKDDVDRWLEERKNKTN